MSQAYQELNVREQPGASELFARLHHRGIKVVLNTGYDRATAEKLIGKIGWKVGEQIDGLVTASDVKNGRPGPEMIQAAMKLTNTVEPSRVAKIGDSQIDIEEGKNANCGMTFGITTGAQSDKQLAERNPTAILTSLNELLDFVGSKSSETLDRDASG